MIFLLFIDMISICFQVYNAAVFIRFIYKSVNHFDSDVENLGKLIYHRITPTQFTAGLFMLQIVYAVYDVYAYSLLVTVCSLGRKSDTSFVVPHLVYKKKTLLKF